MNNKGMIVLCIMAIVALVGWLAALAGRETIEDLTKEIKFLRSENARLESLLKASEARCLSYINGASKEPSTVEAIAALVAKCKRNEGKTCETCVDPKLHAFCIHFVKCNDAFGLHEVPEALAYADLGGNGKEIAYAVDKKTDEYLEGKEA